MGKHIMSMIGVKREEELPQWEQQFQQWLNSMPVTATLPAANTTWYGIEQASAAMAKAFHPKTGINYMTRRAVSRALLEAAAVVQGAAWELEGHDPRLQVHITPFNK